MRLPDWLTKICLYPLYAPYVWMPGRSFRGKMPLLLVEELMLRDKLQSHLHALVDGIGERSVATPENLRAAENYIIQSFADCGYRVWRQTFMFGDLEMSNLFVVKEGRNRNAGTLVVGAHFDTVVGSPGADDNATGVAALLELARRLRHEEPEMTIVLAAFSNEENGWDTMGSCHFARYCQSQGWNVKAMLSLEMLGTYSDVPDSQQYPYPLRAFYPKTANFIGFVGNRFSRELIRRCVRMWREEIPFPCEGVAAPNKLRDAGRSDHWAFWQIRVPAFMITDTANFRNPLYHTVRDTVDKLDLDRYTRVVSGILRLVSRLAS